MQDEKPSALQGRLEAVVEPVMRFVGYASASALLVAVAPGLVFALLFGRVAPTGIEEVVVRNWGFVVGLLGTALVYATYVPATRRLVLMLSMAGKTCFICLLVVFAPEWLATLLAVVLFDGAAAAFFAVYLLATPSEFPGRR